MCATEYISSRIKYLILICWCLVPLFLSAQAKQQDKAATGFSLVIVDEGGKPMRGVRIIAGEGQYKALTGNDGTVTIKVSPEEVVTISFSGYETQTIGYDQLLREKRIVLVSSKPGMFTSDDVPLPFGTIKKRFVTGSETVLFDEQLEKYPSTDLRNSFTGLVPGLEVRERHGMPGLSPEEKNGSYGITDKINVSARGFNLIYVINDMPSDISEVPLDPNEIESVTVVKDIVGKAMYGPLGADGIVFIKTKHGVRNNKILSVGVESGVEEVDRMPSWCSGSRYAELNNLARSNSGEVPLYNQSDIQGFAANDPYDKFHPSINFREMMLKNTRTFNRANVSSSGGNENVQYSVYLGYNGEGDIYKIGAASDYNRINSRSAVDIKINNFIKTSIEIFAGLSFRRSPNYGYATSETSGEMDLVEFNSVIHDMITTSPVAFPVYASFDKESNTPWFGVSPEYQVNPIGNLTGNGFYNEKGRTGTARFTFDYDMTKIFKGLRSKTFIGFNLLDLVRIGKAEDYIAYIATPSVNTSGQDTILLTKVHNGIDVSNMSRLHDYYYQKIMAYENLSYERSFGAHTLKTDLTGYLYKSVQNGIEIPQRLVTGVLKGFYSYRDKYFVQGVLNMTGTYSFAKDARTRAYPSLGAGWIISDEKFLSSVKFIDYLKLHAEAGILGANGLLERTYFSDDWETNSSGPAFGPYTQGQWFGSTMDNQVNRTYTNRLASPGLTFEKRKEYSIGLDATLFDRRLSFDINFYNIQREGIITQLMNSTPLIIGISSSLPYYNNNKARFTGLETGLTYSIKGSGCQLDIGGNATIQNSEWIKYDEPSYRFGYQSTIGKSIDAYWGQTYLGKFQNDEETRIVPQVYDASLLKGDLKYKDMNNDGAIDDNDRSVLGHTSPRLFYSLFLRAELGNFELTLIGTGRAFYDIARTNAYYWNGWGNNNYSRFVSENIGETYPRLTFYKVNNNFVSSDFWLSKGGYFKIQNLELAYNLPASVSKIIGAGKARLYVRGANLLTFSKIKEIDPESINSGVDSYPLYKTYSAGLKITF